MKDWRAYLGSGLIKEVRPNFRQIDWLSSISTA